MDLLTKDQAAELLGVSRDTLDKLVSTGKLPYYRISERIVRIDRADVIDYIRSARVEPTEPKARKRSQKRRECFYVPGMEVV